MQSSWSSSPDFSATATLRDTLQCALLQVTYGYRQQSETQVDLDVLKVSGKPDCGECSETELV
jgi:hypothetical protein